MVGLQYCPLVPAVKQGDLDFGAVVGEVDRGAQGGSAVIVGRATRRGAAFVGGAPS